MRKIYFDTRLHKYINDEKGVYTSVTTNIGEHHKKFDSKGVAKAVARKQEGLYKGMNYRQILKQWKDITETAQLQGTEEHGVLETGVKAGIGFKDNTNNFRQLITIDDILHPDNEHLRNIQVNLDIIYSNLYARHAVIYKALQYFVNNGFVPYPEICVYDDRVMICGMVDLPLINMETKEFILADYKTNKAPIRYEAGYFKKDPITGNITDTFIETGERFYKPLEHLFASTGNKYALQLSMYSKLIEQRGFKHKANVLFHIQRTNEASQEAISDDNSTVKSLIVPYLSNDVELLFNKRYSELNTLF